MIRKTYSKEFNEFWELFKPIEKNGLGQRGNKKRAEERYKQKQIGPEDFDLIRTAINQQIEAKLARRAAGYWDPDFMHVEGWINNERWDDEISCPDNGLCESDRRKQAALRNYLQEDLGEGLDGIDSSEAYREDGGGRVVNLRVLEGKLSGTGTQ